MITSCLVYCSDHNRRSTSKGIPVVNMANNNKQFFWETSHEASVVACLIYFKKSSHFNVLGAFTESVIHSTLNCTLPCWNWTKTNWNWKTCSRSENRARSTRIPARTSAFRLRQGCASSASWTILHHRVAHLTDARTEFILKFRGFFL